MATRGQFTSLLPGSPVRIRRTDLTELNNLKSTWTSSEEQNHDVQMLQAYSAIKERPRTKRLCTYLFVPTPYSGKNWRGGSQDEGRAQGGGGGEVEGGGRWGGEGKRRKAVAADGIVSACGRCNRRRRQKDVRLCPSNYRSNRGHPHHPPPPPHPEHFISP